MEWRDDIENAPFGNWLPVSMRDVNRDPPTWTARRTHYTIRSRRIGYRDTKRECWIARDGLICAPTHWLPAPPETDHG